MYRYLTLTVLLVALTLSSVCGTAIYPKSLRTSSGSASSTPVSALATQDQSGNQDTWSKYVEFYGDSKAYQGVFTFEVPSSINAASVGGYNLDVNFKGPKKSSQAWQFEFFVPATNTWVLAGDNADAQSWKWTELSFCGTTNFADLVKDGSFQVRLSSVTKKDNCDLDYLAVDVSTDGEAPVTSAPVTSAPVTSAPTQKATSAPTEKATSKPTSAPTQKATTAPTEKATSAPVTSAPTQKATSRPTTAPTQKATSAPTQKATSAPVTSAPTQKATSAPVTSAPTQKATSAPATSPPQSPGGRICPTGQVWAPAPGTTWQWQLTGTLDTKLDVQMYDIDLFDNSASVIAGLHAQGRAVICYFSTQYEDWRPDAANWPKSILGSKLDGWPGENWVDIRTDTVRNLIKARLDLAVTKGCDGVEPDNVDEYTNSNGLGLTAADQISFNTFLATEAHKRGLSVGLKNDLDQITQLVSKFDWTLNEQCNEYGECDYLKPFVTAGKAAFGVDYEGSASNICPKMATAKNSWLMKDLDLTAKVTQCCTYASGGCANKPAHRCVTYSAKRSEIDGTEELVMDEVAEVVAEEQDLAAETANFESAYQHSAASTTISAVAIVGFAAVAALVL